MIHCLGCAASFLFLPSFHEIFLHPHPFLPSSGGVVPFVLHYWQTCFGEGTRAKRKSEGEEKKGRKEEGKKKKNEKTWHPDFCQCFGFATLKLCCASNRARLAASAVLHQLRVLHSLLWRRKNRQVFAA